MPLSLILTRDILNLQNFHTAKLQAGARSGNSNFLINNISHEVAFPFCMINVL